MIYVYKNIIIKNNISLLNFLYDSDKIYSCINTERVMATYECDNCGMSVNATCAKCDEPLVDDSLNLDDGSSVQISKCPNGHGKIKSPMCCGNDMSCAI